MLVASPIAGIYADRNGSRALASIGMLVTAIGLGLMTTLQEGTSYWWPGVFMFIVGVGSGMFNSPNTAAMMGVVAPHRRGIASGARVLVQNTGAVLSIAFVMAVVTNGIPTTVLFGIFSGLGTRISSSQMDPFLVEHAFRAVVHGRPVGAGRGRFVRAAQARRAPRRGGATPVEAETPAEAAAA